jgi:hypothetical protein
MDAAASKIMHAIPGRIRLKVAQIRDNPALAAQIQKRLGSVAGVQKIEANIRTSSLILLYDAAALSSPEGFRAFAEPLTALFPELTLPDFEAWQSLSTHDVVGAAALPAVGGMIRSFFGDMNAKIDQATAGGIDLKVLVPLLLFGLSIRSLIKSEKLISPAWYDFLWFALGTYFMLNPKPDEGQR